MPVIICARKHNVELHFQQFIFECMALTSCQIKFPNYKSSILFVSISLMFSRFMGRKMHLLMSCFKQQTHQSGSELTVSLHIVYV